MILLGPVAAETRRRDGFGRGFAEGVPRPEPDPEQVAFFEAETEDAGSALPSACVVVSCRVLASWAEAPFRVRPATPSRPAVAPALSKSRRRGVSFGMVEPPPRSLL
ncbi:hypothetical protein [Halorussus caseinilyticus]|uniref:Uncharacterized protein n=1 Tax=Halorussus caseinilyticus TaxID=3034025 RepID=A0ABD5WMK8_9EURY